MLVTIAPRALSVKIVRLTGATLLLLCAASSLSAQRAESQSLVRSALTTGLSTHFATSNHPFRSNVGQWQSEALFIAAVGDAQLRFRCDGFDVALPREVIHAGKRDNALHGVDSSYVAARVWGMRFKGPQPSMRLEAIGTTASIVSFIRPGVGRPRSFSKVPDHRSLRGRSNLSS